MTSYQGNPSPIHRPHPLPGPLSPQDYVNTEKEPGHDAETERNGPSTMDPYGGLSFRDYVSENAGDIRVVVRQGRGVIMVKVVNEKEGRVIRDIPCNGMADVKAMLDDIAEILFR